MFFLIPCVIPRILHFQDFEYVQPPIESKKDVTRVTSKTIL